MPPDEVLSLRRDLENMRTDVAAGFQAVNAKLTTIHQAVEQMAGRTYVPGGPWWRRLMVWAGFIKLG
jgi:hypothetical protein